ncbi:hypothetical protein BH10PLA1_BH10PLA1_02620 [soil metagenome]
MNTKRSLAIVIVLQTLTLLSMWVGVPAVSSSHAQVPDGGAQRAATLEELKSVNVKLDKLITVLTDGNLQVRVIQPDDKK